MRAFLTSTDMGVLGVIGVIGEDFTGLPVGVTGVGGA